MDKYTKLPSSQWWPVGKEANSNTGTLVIAFGIFISLFILSVVFLSSDSNSKLGKEISESKEISATAKEAIEPLSEQVKFTEKDLRASHVETTTAKEKFLKDDTDLQRMKGGDNEISSANSTNLLKRFNRLIR